MPNLFGTSGFRFTFPGTLTLNTLEEMAYSLALTFPDVEGVIVAHDSRLTSVPVSTIFSSLLSAVGFTVYDAGRAPLPVLAFASGFTEHPLGVMITASHNPPNYNGIKIFKKKWELTRDEENKINENMSVRPRLGNPELPIPDDALSEYLKKLSSEINTHLEKKILVDAGNGTAVTATPGLIKKAGGNVLCVNCEESGYFPGRLPEPNPINLRTTLEMARREGVALGVAHDCDADRVAIFDGKGEFLSQTRALAYFFERKLKENRGGLMVTTVDVGMAVDDIAARYGGKVIRTRLGGSHEIAMKDKSTVIFGEPWKVIDPAWGPWADGIRVAVKLSEDVMDNGSINDLFKGIPDYPYIREDFKFKKWDPEALKARAASFFADAILEDYDGIKLNMDDSWLLFRRSGTEEKIRLYAESKNSEKLFEIKRRALTLLKELDFIYV